MPLFDENRGDFGNVREMNLEPDFSMQTGEIQASQELNIGEMAREGREAERMRNPGVENAIGIATVGVAQMAGEPTIAQMSGVTPHDNRTAEEIAIDAPEVAKDGDKMEKDWMDRARRAISETKNDPHKRLLDASLLREEYMRKRFNRILGERNDLSGEQITGGMATA